MPAGESWRDQPSVAPPLVALAGQQATVPDQCTERPVDGRFDVIVVTGRENEGYSGGISRGMSLYPGTGSGWAVRETDISAHILRPGAAGVGRGAPASHVDVTSIWL
jgi:hypothetical protein